MSTRGFLIEVLLHGHSVQQTEVISAFLFTSSAFLFTSAFFIYFFFSVLLLLKNYKNI